ncbi:MAG: hypothetical protein DRQ06_04050 [Candidatus Hydrothermota bacterium]|nr:MAG: hypothetical protein DRQ06_04050 [Candidatus Hydrothermae bacterium]RKZ01497.1 MAG: hypothetical protein DRQ04_04745 [Candidatus Hydrothermae bacterium]
MSKRFILTFVLMMIFLMIYQFFFYKPPQRPVGTARKEKETKTADTSLTASVEKVVEENPVVVVSPLYEVRISRKGALLTGYRLKKYRDALGKPVELIPAGYGLLDVISDGLHWKDLDFTSPIDTLRVEGEAELTLTAVSGEDTLRKTFRFTENSYLIDLSLAPGDTFNILFPSGLNTTEKDRKDDLKHFYFIYFKDKTRKVSLNSLKKKPFTESGYSVLWAGTRTKYFMITIIPDDGNLRRLDAKATDSRISFGVKSTGHRYHLYFGPIDYFILKDIGFGLASAFDFGAPIISIFSKLILYAFKFLYSFIPNYGWVIVVFAFLMKLVFWPFTMKNLQTMKKMQELNPKMDALRKTFKDDPQRLQQEMMELYRKHKVNPFSGCLIMIFQLPIFWGLYKILRTTIDLRGAPFILWIRDLSSKDPYYVLPILMGIASMAQALMQPAQDQQSRMFALFMPLVLTFIFLNFPAGIVLYWLTYSLLGLVEQYLLKRK